MGTPVKIREREDQCVGAGPCSESRPMTKEEMLKYYTKEEIERMSKKLEAPAKEKLLRILAELLGKTKAIYHASKVFGVSTPVIYGWIKEYAIEFDADGKVIVEEKTPEQEVKEELLREEPKLENPVVNEFIGEQLQKMKNLVNESIKGPNNTITITGQETKEISKRLGYAEHDIGNATIIYDFRADLVKVVTPNDNEMTPEVARAVAEDILDILGHE
jgi:hypothetical protein